MWTAIRGSTEIAIGNVVGSNITNILLILGISALVRPLPVQRASLALDLPVLLLASALLVGLGAWGNALSWWDGLILIAVFTGYMVLLFRNALKERRTSAAPEAPRTEKPAHGKWMAMKQKTWFLIVLTLVGLGMVVGGGTLLVDGARYVAKYFGVGEDIIGLTVVALGTSLPELVTSVVAAAKGETDIAVGNFIGSNIFNIFLVAGVSSLFHPLAFSVSRNLVDALVALGAGAMLLLFALAGKKKLARWAGAVMLLCFLGYYVYLFLVRV